MSDRTRISGTEAVQLAPVVAFPAERLESRPAPFDEEFDAMAHDLERIVDARGTLLRRATDIIVAATALAVLLPVMLLIVPGIKLDSRGPVFYTQDRVGINRRRRERRADDRAISGRRRIVAAGRPFRIYKFRTMHVDAEAAGPQWARIGDPRVTRFGRLLRKTRLDEVPQFINVMRGDMTIIGPRPERPFFVNFLQIEIPHYSKRLLVKPGITGLAQVSNGYDDSIESVRNKVKWDLRYIRTQSLRANLRIVLDTVRTVLTGEGAC